MAVTALLCSAMFIVLISILTLVLRCRRGNRKRQREILYSCEYPAQPLDRFHDATACGEETSLTSQEAADADDLLGLETFVDAPESQEDSQPRGSASQHSLCDMLAAEPSVDALCPTAFIAQGSTVVHSCAVAPAESCKEVGHSHEADTLDESPRLMGTSDPQRHSALSAMSYAVDTSDDECTASDAVDTSVDESAASDAADTSDDESIASLSSPDEHPADATEEESVQGNRYSSLHAPSEVKVPSGTCIEALQSADQPLDSFSGVASVESVGAVPSAPDAPTPTATLSEATSAQSSAGATSRMQAGAATKKSKAPAKKGGKKKAAGGKTKKKSAPPPGKKQNSIARQLSQKSIMRGNQVNAKHNMRSVSGGR